MEIPQILIGASNSKSMGWDWKISLAFTQSPLISVSVSLTSLPLESTSLSIILSMSISCGFSNITINYYSKTDRVLFVRI